MYSGSFRKFQKAPRGFGGTKFVTCPRGNGLGRSNAATTGAKQNDMAAGANTHNNRGVIAGGMGQVNRTRARMRKQNLPA